jgi:hypothetical protein
MEEGFSMRLLKSIGWLFLGVVGLTVATLITRASDQLQVRRIGFVLGDDGAGLEIVNTSLGPLVINNVRVNERADCVTYPFFGLAKDGKFPVNLKVGDKMIIGGSCRVIRTQIITDKGSASYSFN